MNANWFGLFDQEEDRVSKILRRIFGQDENFFSRASAKLAGWFADSSDTKKANTIYSVLASGAGIFGLGNKKPEGLLWWKHDGWDLNQLEEDVNGGINHFGSPFNFPEEFTSVYRLHALVPDLIEYREREKPNNISLKIPVIDTVRSSATEHMHKRGIDNWALSMGRQRLGLLHLRNLPLFLQNLPMPHLDSETKKLDIVALDIIRDRERGIPRFNEFRRQIGLKTLTSFDDFIDQHLDKKNPGRKHRKKQSYDCARYTALIPAMPAKSYPKSSVMRTVVSLTIAWVIQMVQSLIILKMSIISSDGWLNIRAPMVLPSLKHNFRSLLLMPQDGYLVTAFLPPVSARNFIPHLVMTG